MSKKKKLLQKIRNNQKAVSFKEITKLLDYFGFELKRAKGSHHIFFVEIEGEIFTVVIPFKKPHILPIYVKKSLVVIDIIEELEND